MYSLVQTSTQGLLSPGQRENKGVPRNAFCDDRRNGNASLLKWELTTILTWPAMLAFRSLYINAVLILFAQRKTEV
jgi:hypothetical protein